MRTKRETRSNTRQSQRLFEIGSYWLGYEANSEYLFYYWYDQRARRTCRKTTGLRDLEAAKRWLAKFVLAEPPDEPHHPDNVTIAAVRYFYFQHHASAMRSRNVAARAFDLVRDYLEGAGSLGAPKVGDFTLARQEGFMRWCRDAHGLSAKTISTYLSQVKAGCRFAATPRLIKDARAREREAKVLSAAPYIADNEEYVCRVTALPRSRPRDWIPSDAELARLMDAATEEHVFRYLILALNTWARPEAITELSVKAQVSFEQDRIDLNPPGRLQNKKVRPLIRLTGNLKGWLLYWNLDRPIVEHGRLVARVDNRTLRKMAQHAAIPECQRLTRYTLRHYMATRVRRVDGISVTREERAAWLGHVDPHYRTTEAWYESQDPDYLFNVARATDGIMLRLDQLAHRSLFAPNSRPSSGLTLLKNAVS